MEHWIISEATREQRLEALLTVLIVGSVLLVIAAAMLDLIVWGIGRYRARRAGRR